MGERDLVNQFRQIESSFNDRLFQKERAFGVVPAAWLLTPTDRESQYLRFERMVRNTPLDSIRAANGATIWLKIEAENPSESHYDRATPVVLKKLEQEGFLKPGDTILEGTSGSAGRSFAYFCHRLGFKLKMIVPHIDEFPDIRKKPIEDLGAEVIHADEKGGIAKVIQKFRRMVVGFKIAGYEREELILEGKPVIILRKGGETIVAPNHAEIDITPRAFSVIGSEVLAQLPSGAVIDLFVSTLGNGSTLKGISEVLRSAHPNLAVIGIETQHAPTNAIRRIREELVTSGGFIESDFNPRKPNLSAEARLRQRFEELYGFRMPERNEMTYHDSFGASTSGYEPPFIEVDKLAGIVLVGNEWRDYKRRYNTYAWLIGHSENYIGNTTAENLYVAHQLARLRGFKGRNILVINYDKGDQYSDWPPALRTYTYPIQGSEPQEEIPYSVKTFSIAA